MTKLVDNNYKVRFFNNKLVNRHFHKHLALEDNIAAATTLGTAIITVSSSQAWVGSSGTPVEIESSAGVFTEDHYVIKHTTANRVILDRQLWTAYTTGASIETVRVNMNSTLGTEAVGAVSSTNPIIYEVYPPPNESWIITRVLLSITDGTQPDDGNFGGIGALKNGVTLHQHASTGVRVIANWKTGGDMVECMYDIDYRARAGAGVWGVRGRWTFTKAGVNYVLHGRAHTDKLECIIQDDLSDLTSFEMRAQGYVFNESTGA